MARAISSTTATPRPRRPNEAAIYTAALEEFSASGFNGTSMRKISARAGTSLANLYNYVPAKADLLAHVLRQANDDLRGVLCDALSAATAGATAELVAAVSAYVLWSVREQTAGVVAMSEVRYLSGELRDEVVAGRDQTQQLFGDIVSGGVASGEFATPHPHAAARNLALLCAAFATWYRADGQQPPEELVDEQVRLALAMVEAMPA